MSHITNCPRCGACYEESSEESANDPLRLCRTCRADVAGPAMCYGGCGCRCTIGGKRRSIPHPAHSCCVLHAAAQRRAA